MSSKLLPTPYQLVALSKLHGNSFRGLLICDGVGVGKTISAGYIIRLHHGILNEHVVVGCPPILIRKWSTELREKFGIHAVTVAAPGEIENVWDAVRAGGKAGLARVYLLSYPLLARIDLSDVPSFGLMVLDEIHTVRNADTKTHRAARKLGRASCWRIGLTATPIHNSLSDIVSEFAVLFPDIAPEVIDAVVNEVWRTNRTQVLHPWTTRFTKERLSLHFTERRIRQETVRYPAAYVDDVENRLSEVHPKAGRGPPSIRLETITRFRLAASSPTAFYASIQEGDPRLVNDTKLARLLSCISEFPGERWLVFCEFVETAKLIADSIHDRETLLLTGETQEDERQSILNRFNAAAAVVLVMTHVGSEGLDLQSCSHLANYDLHWNPMVLEQRIGRIDRIGQQKSEVYVLNFVVDGSIDERVLRVLGRKLRLVAHTFADPGDVLDSHQSSSKKERFERLVVPDEKLLDEELVDADRFLRTMNLTAAIPSEDYKVAAAIDPSSCEFEKWPSNDLAWSHGLPWQSTSTDVASWFQVLSSSSERLKRLLSEFGRPVEITESSRTDP